MHSQKQKNAPTAVKAVGVYFSLSFAVFVDNRGGLHHRFYFLVIFHAGLAEISNMNSPGLRRRNLQNAD